MYIFDVDTGFTSECSRWFEHLEAVARRVINGRPLTKKLSDFMNDMQGEKREIEPESEGKLYGRGATDMKGFFACAINTAICASKLDLKTPLHLGFSYNEEIGCVGVRPLTKLGCCDKN